MSNAESVKCPIIHLEANRNGGFYLGIRDTQ